MPTYYPPGKRKGNETFVVRGYINGKQYEIATDAGNKREAEKAWGDFASDTRREQRDAIRDQTTATVDWACEEYLESHPNVGDQYRKNVQRFGEHFTGWLLSNVTAQDIYDAAHKIAPNTKPQTKNARVVTPAAAVMHYMANRRLCEYFKIPTLEPEGVERPITYPEQLEPLIQVATGELRAFLMTLQIHGWRVSEVRNIREEKIDWKRAQIIRWVAKSREWRRSAVDREILKAWSSLPKRDDGYIFNYRQNYQVYRAIDKLIADSGLKMKYRPHRSRRGLATFLRDLQYSRDDIRDAGQWANSASVDVYIRDDPERSRPMFDEIRGAMRGRLKKVK